MKILEIVNESGRSLPPFDVSHYDGVPDEIIQLIGRINQVLDVISPMDYIAFERNLELYMKGDVGNTIQAMTNAVTIGEQRKQKIYNRTPY